MIKPVHISLTDLGKKFGPEWIFRGLDHEINAGDKLLISGGNGSGKSTLLQVISGYVTPNEGNVKYSINGTAAEEDDLKDHISFASPYLQLIEDFTLAETIEHARIFKPFINKLSVKEVMERIELFPARDKFIRQFSSGMKQRLKLGLAILADTPVLLLDEPVSNLDQPSIAWYREMILEYATAKTAIVCSNNIEEEHFFCTSHLSVTDFKIKKRGL